MLLHEPSDCLVELRFHDREVQAGAIYLRRLFLQHLPEDYIIHWLLLYPLWRQ